MIVQQRGALRSILVLFVAVAAACSSAEPADEAPDELTLEEFLAIDTEGINRAFDECLESKGWPIEPGGGVLVPEEQMEQYDRAALECQHEVAGAGVVPDRPVSREVHEYFYAEGLGFNECLLANGFPTPEVPTLEAFLEMLGRDEWWDPFAEVRLADRAADTTEGMETALEVCGREALNLR